MLLAEALSVLPVQSEHFPQRFRVREREVRLAPSRPDVRGSRPSHAELILGGLALRCAGVRRAREQRLVLPLKQHVSPRQLFDLLLQSVHDLLLFRLQLVLQVCFLEDGAVSLGFQVQNGLHHELALANKVNFLLSQAVDLFVQPVYNVFLFCFELILQVNLLSVKLDTRSGKLVQLLLKSVHYVFFLVLQLLLELHLLPLHGLQALLERVRQELLLLLDLVRHRLLFVLQRTETLHQFVGDRLLL
mmetsp:Transcript_30661/g.51622  ORF Transcript_30661/g.51622 Transcript_30661/m.51622 type:complete len:246 (+) Transcript_30661:335-1072(+)